MVEEKIRRPKPVSGVKRVDQLGILVLDGSGSMGNPDPQGRTKAQAVSEAVLGLIKRLQTSSRSIDYSLSLIAFDDQVEPPRLLPTPVADIDGDNLNTNPYLGGQTAIGDALEKAGEIAEEFLNRGGELRRSVAIMLMSDGENITGINPLTVAESLKEKFKMFKETLEKKEGKICCVFYGKENDPGVELLKKICSEPVKPGDETFKTVDDAESLKTFFEKSLMEE